MMRPSPAPDSSEVSDRIRPDTKRRVTTGNGRGLETYLLSVLRGRRGVIPFLLRGILSVLALVYRAGLEIYLLPFQLGIRRRTRLPCVVISVGNLTTGGTGKTPMTLELCRLLKDSGQEVAVLSRGYGGRNEHGCAVASNGETVLLSPEEAGDEAYLLAHALPGVPIVVGKDRRVSGELALGQFQPGVIVLDDGMQYWQLHRDLDILLLNAKAPFDNGWTFPRGLLREPPSHLARAGVVVLTGVQRVSKEHIDHLIARVRRLAPGRPIFTADLEPVQLRDLADQRVYPVSWMRGRRIALFSALANPTAFEETIECLGGVPVHRSRFRDHHALSDEELREVMTVALAAGAVAVVTTEKDAVKLAPKSWELPILTLQVRLKIDQKREFARVILDLVTD